MRLTFLTPLALALATTITASTQGGSVAENWQKHCAKCHGAHGKGDTKMGKKSGVKDMTTAEYQASLKDDQAFKSIKEGLKEEGKERMKPSKDLSDQEIKDLVAYLRTFHK
jgi:cytochrome c553